MNVVRTSSGTSVQEPAPVIGSRGKEMCLTAESSYIARLLEGDEDTEAYERLRYAFFVQEKKWVAPHALANGREADRYDAHAQHLGVFDADCLVGYLRVLPWQPEVGFMIDDEFACLLPEEERNALRRTGAIELSRLVVAPATNPQALADACLTARVQRRRIAELLFRLLYTVSLRDNILWYYAVVEDNWLPGFIRRFRLPFQPLGHPYTFLDGTRTRVIRAYVPDLEASLIQEVPDKMQWYRQAK